MQSKEKARVQSLKKLLADRSIILVSNRGPIQFDYDDAGEIEAKRGGGGLVTAMTAVSEETHATWISAAMTDAERSLARARTTLAFPKENPLYHLRLIDIPESMYNQYYNVISNPLLWFIQHYIWDLAKNPSFTSEVHDAWHNGYVAANRIFAEAAVDACRGHERPIIMLQDYHLYTAAKHIREMTDKPLLFHFTHIPWPEPDYLSVLPQQFRVELLEGILSNDLVGFQSRRYANNFLLCCRKLLGCRVNWRRRTVRWKERDVYVRAYPISIDHTSLQTFSETDPVNDYEARLEKDYEGLKLIVRSDRSDLSKNIVRGFRAFETLLEKHPGLAGQVKFLALLYPTRENIKEYTDYRIEIEQAVADINNRLKTADWTPIYLRLYDNYEESVAALKVYDVLLVNPIYDGMNLVAKEGPVVNKRNGVLVLSENAGASEELRDAGLVVNPFDIDGTADALYQALTMSERDKATRSAIMKEIVTRNNSIKWLHYQLKDIVKLEKKKPS
ncbi:MAG: trehalose-6-phosphate synthase [Candidatus Aquicultor sp.]|nr:trehalose-6-phosphate synthase [Candidatus Aquicultor sp.]